MNYQTRLTLVATLELLSALLFLFAPTRSIGLLLVSAFLGGAIATHVQSGEYSGSLAPALFMSLCWLGAWLRHPEVLWSIKSVSATHRVSSRAHTSGPKILSGKVEMSHDRALDPEEGRRLWELREPLVKEHKTVAAAE